MTQYMQQGQTPPYNVDLVMCIDGTQSMVGIIKKIKVLAKAMPALFSERMVEEQKTVGKFRVKLIVFRDYKYDGAKAMEQTTFFDMSDPNGQCELEKAIMDIVPSGGGDLPENALEAIAEALKSDWTTDGGYYRRHAIMVFTDADALPLQDADRVASPNYPRSMPKDQNELKSWFKNGISDQEVPSSYVPSKGRLIVYAPKTDDNTWWQVDKWSANGGRQVFVIPTKLDGGCDEIDFKDALGVLAGTI